MTKTNMSLVLAITAVVFCGTVSIGQVRADDNCNPSVDSHCGTSCHVGYHFDGTSCQPWLNSYIQHSTYSPVYWDCSKNLNNPNCGFSTQQQPHLTTVVYCKEWDTTGFACKKFSDDSYQQNNCFWSFPVQCKSE